MRRTIAGSLLVMAVLAGSAMAQGTDPNKVKDQLTGDAKGSAADNPQCRLFTTAEIAAYLVLLCQITSPNDAGGVSPCL